MVTIPPIKMVMTGEWFIVVLPAILLMDVVNYGGWLQNPAPPWMVNSYK